MAIPRFKPEPCPFIGQPCEYVPMAHRMVKLEKEIERLREALNTIAATKSIPEINPSVDYKMMWIGCTQIASLALKESE